MNPRGISPSPKEVIKMNRTEIEQTMRTLAMSQGMYGRILNWIYSLPSEEQDGVWAELESQNFKDALDVVLYWESDE